jgi:hypothetical protein
MVESETWQTLFPTHKPVPGAWEQNSWLISPGGTAPPGKLHRTVTAYGTGSSIVGSRSDLLIGDDLLDFDNTRTSHQRSLVESWFYNSFLTRRKAGGRVIMIGTSWNSEDLLAKIRKEDTGWLVCHMPTLDEGGDGYHAYLQYPDNWKHEVIGEKVGA